MTSPVDSEDLFHLENGRMMVGDEADDRESYFEDLESEAEAKANKRGRRMRSGTTSLPKMRVTGASVKLHAELAHERAIRLLEKDQ